MKIEDAIKQQEFRTPQEKAWINLVYTYNQCMDAINGVFREFDITHQQFNVLKILKGRKGEPANCGEVKEVMLDKNPDLTRLSDRLIAKDLIERGVNEQNRREVQLQITQKGLDLLDRVEPALKKQNSFLFKLSDDEAATLSDMLDKLRE